MTTFDEREQGYEAAYAHDREIDFKAQARRDRLLGMWAGDKLGLTGDALEDYALGVMRADLQEPGDEDVYRKLMGDFEGKGTGVTETEVRAQMTALLAIARAEVQAGR